MEISTDIISLASATLRISTPLVFAAMAGLFAERSGVIDFGLEGKMLAAAFVAAVELMYLDRSGMVWDWLLCVVLLYQCFMALPPLPTKVTKWFPVLPLIF